MVKSVSLSIDDTTGSAQLPVGSATIADNDLMAGYFTISCAPGTLEPVYKFKDENGVVHSRHIGNRDSVWKEPVLSRTTLQPTGSEVDGDRYIVPVGATGAFAGQDNNIAMMIAGVWKFAAPLDLTIVAIVDELRVYMWVPGQTSWFSDVVSFQTVYVSTSGNDSSDGRSPGSPVATLAQAITLATALPSASKRLIKCIDASIFTDDISLATPIDFDMPKATVTGNINNATPARCEIHVGVVIGNVAISNGSHYFIGQLNGDLNITSASAAASCIQIQDYVAGTFDDSGAAGDVCINISHDDVGVVPSEIAGYNPYGRIGSVSYPIVGNGDREPVNASVVLDGTGQLVELISFADSTGNADATRRDMSFSIAILDSSNILQLLAKVTFIAEIGRQRSFLRIDDYVSNLPDSVVSEFRLTYDTSNPAEGFKVTYLSNLNGTYSMGVLNTSVRTIGSDVTVGSFNILTLTGNEVDSSIIDTAPWQDANIAEGSEGGAAFHTIGDVSNSGSYIDFRNRTLDMLIEGSTVGKFSSHGTRLSAGEYGSWIAPTSTDWPIDAVFWTNLIAEKRTDTDDVSLNPSSTITWSAVDAGGVNAATMTGYDGGHRGLRFTNAGSGGLTMTFANCLYQRLTLTLTLGVATTAGGATQDYEFVDNNGQVFATFQTPGTSNAGDTFTFSQEITTGDGDTVVTLRKASTGTSQAVYLFNYGMQVNVDEPALEPNVVVQQDSPLRGTMLPRILPSSSINHPQGSMALNGLAQNRPIWHDGTDWAYLNTTRNEFTSVDNGQFFFAEGNTLAEAGWTGSQMQRWVNTLNHQGFPEVIRITQTGGTVTAKAPNNTQALWDVARANGFRVDFRMMFGATHDGQIWADIEPNNTSWGSNGRFEFNVTVNAGQLQITMINSGGNTTFDIERDVMHTISMICPPNSDVADIYLEGSKIGEVTYAGSGTTDRGTFFYIPPGNAVNDMVIQSVTMYTLDAAQRDVTLDKTALTTGLRYNIPNVNSASTIRVPKGLYDFGNTFTVVNGSTETATIRALDDDHQLFGGSSTFEVLPQKEVTFTQTAFPRGNVWAVEGGKTVINHNENISIGNTLHLTVDSAGTVTGRHGTYLGAITVTRVTTGQYSITAGGHVWGDELTVVSTPKHTAGTKMSCNYGLSLGSAIIDVLDAGGNAVSDSFSASLYW